MLCSHETPGKTSKVTGCAACSLLTVSEPGTARIRTYARTDGQGRSCPRTHLPTVSLQLFRSKKLQENEPLTASFLEGPERGPRPALGCPVRSSPHAPGGMLTREGSWRHSCDSDRRWKGCMQPLERVQRDRPTGPTGAPDTGSRVTSAAGSLRDDLEAISPREGSGAERHSHGDQVGGGRR